MVKEILVTLIFVSGNYAIPQYLGEHAVKEAAKIIERETGERLVVKYIEHVDDPRPELQSGDKNRKERAEYFYAHLYNRGLLRSDGINVVIDVPLLVEGERIVSGLSPICARKGGTAFVQAVDVSRSEQNLIAATIVVLAHEIGHLLGAQHATDSSLMSPAAATFTPAPQHYNERTKREIRHCKTYNNLLAAEPLSW